MWRYEVEVEVEVNLRPTVTRPVCPGVWRPSGTRDQFFFLLGISFRQLRLCYFVAPYLTRGRVCNFLVQLLLGLARAVTLGSKFCRTHGHILLSHLRLPQSGGPGSRVYIPQEQGGPVISPSTGFVVVCNEKMEYILHRCPNCKLGVHDLHIPIHTCINHEWIAGNLMTKHRLAQLLTLDVVITQKAVDTAFFCPNPSQLCGQWHWLFRRRWQ
jgi:hypothetical protein